jgi:hypothetical protein
MVADLRVDAGSHPPPANHGIGVQLYHGNAGKCRARLCGTVASWIGGQAAPYDVGAKGKGLDGPERPRFLIDNPRG